MSLELWLAFVAASTAILLLPGPTVMLVVGYALGAGRRAAFGALAGVLVGDLVAISVSAIGLGAILAASATLFTVMKFLGAAYLIWLGINLWRAPVDAGSLDAATQAAPDATHRRENRKRAANGFIVTALNPKSLAFFIAFLPQFMTAGAPVMPQLLILAPTFVGLAALTNGAYALAAAGVRTQLRSPRALRAINRVGGSCLIGAGLVTATMKRA